MERNLTFFSDNIKRIRTKLTWAQLEMVSSNMDEFQLIIAGDEDSVDELRMEQSGEDIVIAQPQLGYAKEILPRNRWLQICLRIPEKWNGDMDIDSISGMVGVRKLNGGDISLTTMTGSIHADGVHAGLLWIHTISGAIAGNGLSSKRGHFRTVSGSMGLTDIQCDAIKVFTVSGETSLSLTKGGHSLDIQSVSGKIFVEVDEAINASMHSLSGQFLLGEEVEQSETGFDITATSVSGDLTVSSKKAV